MKKILILLLVSFVFGCAAKPLGHDLRKNLGQKKDSITKALGEPATSEPYGGTTRISYEGEYAGVPGTWSYYALDSDSSVVSTEFTAKGQHQAAFLEAMVASMGQPMSVEAMTADIPQDDVMGAIVIGQIKQRYDAGMRTWNDLKQGVSFILDVAPEGNGEAFMTTVVAIDEKKLTSLQQEQVAPAGEAMPAAEAN
ncbi:MAG: hypothetical protein ACRCVN_07315 [Spirochaetia bacterium]